MWPIFENIYVFQFALHRTCKSSLRTDVFFKSTAEKISATLICMYTYIMFKKHVHF